MPRYKKWTDDEIAYLKINCKTTSINEISKILGRSYQSINTKCKTLNLNKIFEWNLIGRKIGRLKVLKFYDIEKHRRRWLCRCKCGNEKIVSGKDLEDNRTRSCGCLQIDYYKSIYKGYNDLSGAYWGAIKKSASKRGYEFTITKRYVWDLFLKQNKKCAISNVEINLCGMPKQDPKNNRKKLRIKQTASLDRIDSTKGYIKGNIQWVHKTVNYMKLDMSDNEFIEWCNKISDFHRINN